MDQINQLVTLTQGSLVVYILYISLEWPKQENNEMLKQEIHVFLFAYLWCDVIVTLFIQLRPKFRKIYIYMENFKYWWNLSLLETLSPHSKFNNLNGNNYNHEIIYILSEIMFLINHRIMTNNLNYFITMKLLVGMLFYLLLFRFQWMAWTKLALLLCTGQLMVVTLLVLRLC